MTEELRGMSVSQHCLRDNVVTRVRIESCEVHRGGCTYRGAILRRLQRLTISLMAVGLAIYSAGCSGTPDDGRVVKEGGTEARDLRLSWYEYAEEGGHSAVWWDEQVCTDTIADVVGLAREKNQLEISSLVDPEHPWDDYYASLDRYEDNLATARELGDSSWEAALLLLPQLVDQVAAGETSVFEVSWKISDACALSEMTEAEVDQKVAIAFDMTAMLDEVFANWFVAPTLNRDTGYFDWPLAGKGESASDGVGDADEALLGTQGVKPAETDEEWAPESEDALTCDDLIVVLMGQYAYGEIDMEDALNHLNDDARESFRELLDFVMEEVSSGSTHPNDVGMLKGSATWEGACK